MYVTTDGIFQSPSVNTFKCQNDRIQIYNFPKIQFKAFLLFDRLLITALEKNLKMLYNKEKAIFRGYYANLYNINNVSPEVRRAGLL